MQAARNPDPSFWAGKRVLVTGHTGFKGSWLALWLRRLGANVVGIGLPPITTPSLFGLAAIDALVDSRIGDIRDAREMAPHGYCSCEAAVVVAGRCGGPLPLSEPTSRVPRTSWRPCAPPVRRV